VGKQADLEKLDRTIKDGEIRLRTVKTNIDSLSREIATLDELEIQLNLNLQCLKEKKIIAIATEYKKAKEDLAKTKTRRIALSNDREHFKKAVAEVEIVMKKAKEELDEMNKEGNNVLYVEFGGKVNG
jgi:chromosome segregation ATPase